MVLIGLLLLSEVSLVTVVVVCICSCCSVIDDETRGLKDFRQVLCMLVKCTRQRSNPSRPGGAAGQTGERYRVNFRKC